MNLMANCFSGPQQITSPTTFGQLMELRRVRQYSKTFEQKVGQTQVDLSHVVVRSISPPRLPRMVSNSGLAMAQSKEQQCSTLLPGRTVQTRSIVHATG